MLAEETFSERSNRCRSGEIPDGGSVSDGISTAPLETDLTWRSISPTYIAVTYGRAMSRRWGRPGRELLGMKNYQTLDAQLKRLRVTGDLHD